MEDLIEEHVAQLHEAGPDPSKVVDSLNAAHNYLAWVQRNPEALMTGLTYDAPGVAKRIQKNAAAAQKALRAVMGDVNL